jgi:hypothetical protein
MSSPDLTAGATFAYPPSDIVARAACSAPMIKPGRLNGWSTFSVIEIAASFCKHGEFSQALHRCPPTLTGDHA